MRSFSYVVTLVNNGIQGSSSTTLTVNLPPQVSLTSTQVDRGPGCTASGQVVTCPLDFFPSGLTQHVILNVTVTATGTLVCSASDVSVPPDANPADDSASLAIAVGVQAPAVASPVFTQQATSPPPASARPATVTVVAAPKPVSLSVAKPVLTLTTKLSKATTLNLVLLNAKGHVVARWTRRVKAGAAKLSLVLPVQARKAGRNTLRITPSGQGKAKTTSVVLRR